MADEHQRWHRRQLMDRAAVALEKNGFTARLFDDREAAVSYLIEATEGSSSVGFGGSMTLAQLQLPELVAGQGKETLVHGRPGLSDEERLQIMREQLTCDLFMTSTNALTLGGHLVNIDGNGNRVCAMAFGPKKVVVVAGANKIASDDAAALKRVKEVACPPNARRLGFRTPCATTGVCADCDAEQRICRITTIIERCPRPTPIEICLINENLGY
ncbi:MAG: lactate utilization protein [Desulfuromonadales bacterium]|nr:lactate utilization protein [Desulfuromonadales bacterium]NIR33095.1 lactate utilization protein [Desulfuromonadales bacterium]NIS41874.1 lactate utilization protein [Desulfuromonadales bacterium]